MSSSPAYSIAIPKYSEIDRIEATAHPIALRIAAVTVFVLLLWLVLWRRRR